MQAIGENTVLAQRYTLTRKLAGRADHGPAEGRPTESASGGTMRYESSRQELWIATDATLGREVTATVFPSDFDHAEAALDSARRAAGVEDRHLPRVLDVGRENGTAYVITEALHGADSIAAMLQFDPLPAEEVRRMVGEAASGLGAASARGLHHLQLTPHDIVCSPDGAVSVLGLPTDAALAGADDMSSEEASRTDTIALVQVVYAGLTRRWPGTDPVPGLQNVSRRADGELPAPSELVPGVPGDLDTLCRTTLGADEGPRTPGELARQLAPWSSERVTTSTRRTTGSGGKSAATLHAVPGGDRSSQEPVAADTADQSAKDPTAAVETDESGPTTAAAGSTPLHAPLPKVGVASGGGSEAGDETAQISHSDLMQARERTAAPPDEYDDDYDPSYVELEPPVPGLVGHGYEPDHQSSRLALLIVVLLVVVAIVFAVIGLHGIGGSSSPDDAASSGATSSASSPSSKHTNSSKPKPAAKALAIQRTLPWGINGGENAGLIPQAIDDSPSSYWQTHDYRTENGRGSGSGILLDLGGVKSVDNVKVTTSGGPSTVQIYVSDVIQSVSNRDPAATLTGSGKQTADLKGVKARYITVWVTKLSKQSDGQFQERINDIKVYP